MNAGKDNENEDDIEQSLSTTFSEMSTNEIENATLNYSTQTAETLRTTSTEQNAITSETINDTEKETNETFEASVLETITENVINKTDSSTTEAIVVPISTARALQPDIEQIDTTDDLTKLTLPSLSQIIPEIDEILLDLSDKNPDFIGGIDFKHVDDRIIDHNPKQRANDRELDDSTIIPLMEHNSQVQRMAEHVTESVASVQTEQYELVDAFFVPSPSAEPRSDAIDAIFIENTNQTANKSRYRLENTTMLSDNDFLSFDDAAIIDSGNDQQSNIELIKDDDATSSTDESIEQNNDGDSLKIRLAEELLFQGPTVKPIDAHDASVSTTTEEWNDPGDSSSAWTHIYGIADISDSSDAPKIEDATKAENITNTQNITTEPKSETDSDSDSPTSTHSILINRLITTPSTVQVPDPTEQSTRLNDELFEISSTIEPEMESKKSILDPSSAIKQSPPSIIEQPPNQSKSLRFGINCYLKNLINKQYFCIEQP